jgi:hypothetical protein
MTNTPSPATKAAEEIADAYNAMHKRCSDQKIPVPTGEGVSGRENRAAWVEDIAEIITKHFPAPPRQDARVAFEAHCRTAGLYPMGKPGEYTHDDTVQAWLTWQAAWQAALTSPQAAAGVDEWCQGKLLEIGAAISDFEEATKDCEHILTKDGETAYARSSREKAAKLKQRLHRLVAEATPSPAPAARANLTEEDLEAIGYARHDQKAGGDSSQWTVGQLLAIIDRLAPLPAATEGEK